LKQKLPVISGKTYFALYSSEKSGCCMLFLYEKLNDHPSHERWQTINVQSVVSNVACKNPFVHHRRSLHEWQSIKENQVYSKHGII